MLYFSLECLIIINNLSMCRLLTLNIVVFIFLASAQKVAHIDGAQHYTENKERNSDLTSDQEINLGEYLEIPRLAQEAPSVPINHLNQQISQMTDYLATKSVYPDAVAPQNSIPFQIPKEFYQATQSTATQIDNSHKEIVWKINYVIPPVDYVLSDGIQVPLSKAQIITSSGQAILAVEGIVQKHAPPIQDIAPVPTINRQEVHTIQKKQEGLDFEPPKRKPISSFQTNIAPSPGTPDFPSNSQLKQQAISQLENLLDKSHRWPIIFVILLLALIFCIFLCIRYQRSKKANRWSKDSPKLSRYRNSVAVGQIQQEDIDFHEADNGEIDFHEVENIDIEDEFENLG